MKKILTSTLCYFLATVALQAQVLGTLPCPEIIRSVIECEGGDINGDGIPEYLLTIVTSQNSGTIDFFADCGTFGPSTLILNGSFNSVYKVVFYPDGSCGNSISITYESSTVNNPRCTKDEIVLSLPICNSPSSSFLKATPNPTSTQAVVSWDRKKITGLVDGVLYNSKGTSVKVLSNLNAADGQTVVDLTNLPTGLYFVRIGHEQHSFDPIQLIKK